jgi:PIN domain nuclease of toxin-antitoxin system
MIFLDTQSLLWLYEGNMERFSPKVVELLSSEELLVSPMVALELSYLFEVGKIRKAPKLVLHELHKEFGLNVDQVDFASVLEVAADESWTRDPFDRIIAAHAKRKNAILISSDRHIQANYKRTMC